MKNCCSSHFKQVVYTILQKSSGSPASVKVRVLPFQSSVFTHFGFRKIEVTFSEENSFTERRTKIEHFKNQNLIALQYLPGLVME